MTTSSLRMFWPRASSCLWPCLRTMIIGSALHRRSWCFEGQPIGFLSRVFRRAITTQRSQWQCRRANCSQSRAVPDDAKGGRGRRAVKAAIQDGSALKSLRPLDLIAYLRAKGWRHEFEIPNKGSLWVLNDDCDLTLPARRELGDYVLRVSEVIRTLARSEDRSELDVLRDIQTTTSDLIRIRVSSQSAEAGALPLEEAVRFIECTRDMMLAAACATIEKRPVYAKRKSQQAMEYLNHAQMGQTERGSFVITVLSPVPPQLRPAQQSLLPEIEPEPPFERQVTETLMGSLGALNSAALDATLISDLGACRG